MFWSGKFAKGFVCRKDISSVQESLFVNFPCAETSFLFVADFQVLPDQNISSVTMTHSYIYNGKFMYIYIYVYHVYAYIYIFVYIYNHIYT